jgi:hypothetical protein
MKMITSKITGKTYEPGNETCVYFSNMLQCAKYFKTLGEEFFLDILYTSKKGEDCLVFVWRKCPETARAKRLWDNHEI